jgi:hypothetical protein
MGSGTDGAITGSGTVRHAGDGTDVMLK